MSIKKKYLLNKIFILVEYKGKNIAINELQKYKIDFPQFSEDWDHQILFYSCYFD